MGCCDSAVQTPRLQLGMRSISMSYLSEAGYVSIDACNKGRRELCTASYLFQLCPEMKGTLIGEPI